MITVVAAADGFPFGPVIFTGHSIANSEGPSRLCVFTVRQNESGSLYYEMKIPVAKTNPNQTSYEEQMNFTVENMKVEYDENHNVSKIKNKMSNQYTSKKDVVKFNFSADGTKIHTVDWHYSTKQSIFIASWNDLKCVDFVKAE